MSDVLHKSKEICLADAKFSTTFKRDMAAALEELKSRLPAGFKWKIRWYSDFDRYTNPFKMIGYFGATIGPDNQVEPIVEDIKIS